ncbi:MAG: MBL fold metallo-hydrolase [Phycisphaerales bacterium]
MQIQFLGANRQVTGSRHVLRTERRTIMIDCGMFQEREHLSRNWDPSPVPPGDIDALLLTHAHLDHCGLIPRFVNEGYAGPILATPATIDLAKIVLEDSARIHVEDASYKKKRHEREKRKGPHPELPLYTPSDAQAALKLFKEVEYDTPIQLGDGIEARYHDAGHILGSALIELFVSEGARTNRIVFSGDLGHDDHPLMRDPHPINRADYAIMESTYGDRDHPRAPDTLKALASIVNETVERKGNLVIPTFAIDRAQELLYLFSELVRQDMIPRLTIFLDSPMAINTTAIYENHPHLFNDEARALFREGRHPFQFPGLHFVQSADESMAINAIRGSCVILAGSGMCTGGRIKHHLRNNIIHDESTILFVGYQARGTLGRQIVQGDPTVRIHGKPYNVNAQVRELHGLSAHADRSGLMDWLARFEEPPDKLFLTHGEEEAAIRLKQHVEEQLGWRVDVPEFGAKIDL